MNPLDDVLDRPPKATTGEIGRTFYFRDIELKKMSWHHSFAFWRTAESTLKFERALTLLYILTLDGAKASAIRSEKEMGEVRMASVEWAEGFGIDDEFVSEAIAKAKEIEDDHDQATSVQPKTKPGPNA